MAIVYRNPHQQALLAAQQEMQQRLQERDWNSRRIVELQEAINKLTPLADHAGGEHELMSLPQLCLRVLSFSPNHGLSVPKIREGLAVMGIDLSSYRNALAVLHTTLGRLEQSGYVARVPIPNTNTTYYQISSAGILVSQQGM